MLSTLKYRLGTKYQPLMDECHEMNLSDFHARGPEKWDQNNLQVYQASQVKPYVNGFCKLKAEKGSHKRMDKLWREFEKDCLLWETRRIIEPWEYLSGALESKKRIDIHVPGRIVIECPMVQGAVGPSVWLFDEWHQDDMNDPLHRKGDHYFEIDIFESGPTLNKKQKCVYCSLHEGTGSDNRTHGGETIRGDFTKTHYYELQWKDGVFYWLINGVLVMRRYVDLNKDVSPKLLVTLGVTQGIPEDVVWKIQSIKYSGL